MHTSDYLRYLRRKQTVTPYPPHLKMSPHYLVKCNWLKVMLRSTTLCWNSAHVTTRHSRTRPYRGLVLDRPTHALVSLIVSKLGCTKFMFIEHGAKINGQYYWDVLLMQKLLPAIRSIARRVCLPVRQCASTSCSWQSRGAVRHRSSSVLVASQQSWPQHGNYHVWDVYRIRIRNTDELRKRLVATWAEFQQIVVDCAVDQWRKRLEACIYAEGGHFEHLLWRCLLDIPVATRHNRFFSEPSVFGGTQHYLQSDQKSFAFYKVVRWHFSGVVGKGVKVCFLMR